MIAFARYFDAGIKWFRHPDRLALCGLLGLLFVFYPELFLVKSAPLTGDHLEQHYPWAYLLAQSVKNFKLPFWTPMIHCGFPLVAESQVGAFYLPNLIMYFFLPFHAAYSYMNLVHWFIAGWGTYLYAKQMKLGPTPSFVAAIIFTFGSAYGGAYYNMTSLKTVCWFPTALYFLERYLESRQWRFLLGIAILIGQSIVAGYMQIAALTWMMFVIYGVLRILMFSETNHPWKERLFFGGALLLSLTGALLLACPQVYLTFRLAMTSNRTGLEEGYAYIGSLSPFTFSTLVNPGLLNLFRGCNLYAGSWPLFLIFLACFSSALRKNKCFGLWFVMTCLTFLLAFGRWSPLYMALIKLTKFYSFRVPSKFLVFGCFGFAMLAALGFQMLWEGRGNLDEMKKAFKGYSLFSGFIWGFIVAGSLFLKYGRTLAVKIGEVFVKTFIYGKPGHPHAMDTYRESVRGYLDTAPQYLSLSHSTNLWMLLMLACCILLIWRLIQKKNGLRPLLIVGVFFLLVDLYASASLDMRLDFLKYPEALRTPAIVRVLKMEKSKGKFGRLYGFRLPNQQLPVQPSSNMLYDLEDVGAYSPLIASRYYETIGLFGNVNDSNAALAPTANFVTERLPLLSFLNVSHILSTTPLNQAQLIPIWEDAKNSLYLYKNQSYFSEAYFISRVQVFSDWHALKRTFLQLGFDPRKTLLLAEKPSQNSAVNGPSASTIRLSRRASNFIEWDLECDSSGFFVISKMNFPGWKARMNGREVPILTADGMFQAIAVEKPGRYRVELLYKPFWLCRSWN